MRRDPKPPNNEVCARCGRWPCACSRMGEAFTDREVFAMPEPPEQIDFVLSVPVFDAEPVPGSTVRTCGDCGESCWVAPATANILQQYPAAVFLCIYCGSKRIDDEPLKH